MGGVRPFFAGQRAIEELLDEPLDFNGRAKRLVGLLGHGSIGVGW
jgi:hypothetical protein